MSHRFTPTVRQLTPLRLLLAGGLTAGAVAAAPAVATAEFSQSTCVYDATFHRVTVTDNSGTNTLRIFRTGDVLAVQDANFAMQGCRGPSGPATVTNTDKILVDSPGGGAFSHVGDVVVDQSAGALAPGFIAENDGNSEIEVQVRYSDVTSTPLTVVGTPQADVIKVGGRSSVLLGTDGDIDISMIHLPSQHLPTQQNALPSHITVLGGAGDDFISGRGNHPAAPSATFRELNLNGEAGNDILMGGDVSDSLNGGDGDDNMFTTDLNGIDRVTGGPGFDGAVLDERDVFTSDVEVNSGGRAVGKLRVAPAILKAQAGAVARAKLSWTHPKAWKALRSVEWRLLDGTTPVGTIEITPRNGRMNADGNIELVRDGSRIAHKGKTVTAKLAVRVPASLAGKQLRVDVQATDDKGRTQLEPSAGLLRVAK